MAPSATSTSDRRTRSACCRWSRAALAAAQWTAADLDGIAFGCGPGSFTGIRIGCAVAQGLGFALDRPLVGVPTLEAIALADGRATMSPCRCLDARMREVYVAVYRRSDGGLRQVVPSAVLAPGGVELPPSELPPARWTGAGNGFAAYPELATRLGLGRVHPEARPTATAIAMLALPRLAAGDGVPAAEALPLYVRHRVALTTLERAAGAVLS